jgi:aryl-alcohol dehydrogenase-like predicted oxidoreductase
MEQRPLGSTGRTVSALGFGCGNVGGLMIRGAFEDQVAAAGRAMDAGITYFDTAAMYGNGRSEENLGRVLNELDAWGRVTVGTKIFLAPEDLGHPQTSVRRRMVEGLKRLDHDSVDLVQLHNNIATASDERRIAIDRLPAVAEAMRGLVREGLVRHAGFTGLGETASVHAAVRDGLFETVQSYVNALNPSAAFAGVSGGSQDFDGLIDKAAARGMGVIAIRVMAAGALIGTSERPPLASPQAGDLVPGSEYDRDVVRAQRLATLARDLGLESPFELSFRFAMSRPGVSTALVGYSDLRQLEDSIRWAERGPLGDDVVRRIVDFARR